MVKAQATEMPTQKCVNELKILKNNMARVENDILTSEGPVSGMFEVL